MKETSLNGIKRRRIYNYMKKIIKIIKILLIVMVYVIMFWGLIKWISYPFTHKTEPKCECACNCEYTEPVIKEEVQETAVVVEEPQPIPEETKKEPPSKKESEPVIKEVKTASKDTYKAFAYDLVINEYLWSESDYQALVKLWTRESDWNPNAVNKSSGACNIPQALPCSKISNMYGDNSWESGIKWGLVYIKNRYGTPTKAWQHFQNKNWY